jgi:exodeoxyribonuclease VII small subunit
VTARDGAQNPSGPAAKRTAAGRPPGEHPAAGRPAERTAAERTAAGPPAERTAAGRPAGERPAGERPAYEQARDELTELVKRLEAGGLTLEQSLELWERGERLAVICEEWLEGARARLAAAMAQRSGDGDAAGAPF